MKKSDWYQILVGDALTRLAEIPDGSVRCCVTSPPYYGLRDYGVDGQLGLEATPEEFIENMVAVFAEVRRVLADDGTLWLNMGDSYAGGKTGRADGDRNGVDGFTGGQKFKGEEFHQRPPPPGLKPKDLCGIPWRLALALQADGWYLRSDIIWHKPNPMPESVTDRPTKSHEYLFLLSKSKSYYYDAEAIKEANTTPPHAAGYTSGEEYATGPMSRNGHSQREGDQTRVWAQGGGRNARTVWTIPTQPYPDAHFATFPEALPERCIKAGSSERGRCPKCLKPWVRQTRTKKLKRQRPNDLTKRKRQAGTGNACPNTVAGVEVEQLGWAPTCSCGKKPEPDVVIDPFLGSGTTIQVAVRLGRRGIGIELNPEYVKLAQQRIAPSVQQQDVGLVQSILKQREPVKGLFDAESDVPFEPGRFT